MGHGFSGESIRNPGSYQVSARTRTLLMLFVIVGVITFALGLKESADRVWSSLVLNHFYFLSLALGGIFFAAIQWITGAMWSAPVRRLSESFTAYLPVAVLTFVVLSIGIHDIYVWSHPEHIKGDLILEGKSGYLNSTFFIVRNLIALGIWALLTRKMVRNSIAQDANGSHVYTERNRMLAAVFLLLFAVTYTMASFDILMSLDPHWFSTMFGVYCFAGLFYANLASVCLLALTLRRRGVLRDIINDNHLHDIGKFMFAFTVFWAYIGFSQFMLIWYANLPEETGYFLHRLEGGWFWVSVFLLVGKFLVPFFVLLPRDAKRNEKVLAFVAWFMLAAQWVDMMWIVQPEFSATKLGPKFGIWEIGITLGFIGAFGLVVSRFLARTNVVAIGDPRLAEAVYHHHQ